MLTELEMNLQLLYSFPFMDIFFSSCDSSLMPEIWFLENHLCDAKEPKGIILFSVEFTLTRLWIYIQI